MPPCNIIIKLCLPPPHILPYFPNPCYLQRQVHLCQIPFPPVAPLFRHPRNMSCDPMMEALQESHHCVRQPPCFTPILNHRLHYLLKHHFLGLEWHSRINQHMFCHPPSPLNLPQFSIQSCPVTFILCCHRSKVWQRCFRLKRLKVDCDHNPVYPKAPLQCLPPLPVLLSQPECSRVIMTNFKHPLVHLLSVAFTI